MTDKLKRRNINAPGRPIPQFLHYFRIDSAGSSGNLRDDGTRMLCPQWEPLFRAGMARKMEVLGS